MVGIIPEAESRRGIRPRRILPLRLGRQTKLRLGIFLLEPLEKVLNPNPGHRLDRLRRPPLVLAWVFAHDSQPLQSCDLMLAHAEGLRNRNLMRLRVLSFSAATHDERPRIDPFEDHVQLRDWRASLDGFNVWRGGLGSRTVFRAELCGGTRAVMEQRIPPDDEATSQQGTASHGNAPTRRPSLV